MKITRRNFMHRAGIGLVAASLAPNVLASEKHIKPDISPSDVSPPGYRLISSCTECKHLGRYRTFGYCQKYKCNLHLFGPCSVCDGFEKKQ
jgi:hypothetical protein